MDVVKDASMKLGAIEVVEVIGRGGMAEVWRGRHRPSGRPVAIKFIPVSERGEGESILEEVRAVARLSHRGIVEVYDWGVVPAEIEERTRGMICEGSQYLVMEFGRTSLLRAGLNPSDWERVKAVIEELLEALAHSHARGVIHRDLKPENVLVVSEEEGDRYVLADFGLAQAYQGRRERGVREHRAYGTPQFMAPEQARGLWREQGPWTDLYALGCMIYWLVQGRAPFESHRPMDILRDQIKTQPPPLRVPPTYPPDFPIWVAGLLRKNPADRYRYAADALRDLRGMGADEEATLEEEWLGFERTEVQENRLYPGVRGAMRVVRPDRERTSQSSLSGVGLGLVPFRSPEMVGREAERDHLWARLREVEREGSVRVTVLRGATGLGATRLAWWLGEEAHEAGAAVVLRAHHGRGEGPGLGLGRLFADFLGIAGLGSGEIGEYLKKWRVRWGASGALSGYDCEALADLLAPAADPDYTSSREGHRRSSQEGLELMARMLGFAARERPVVVLLDELQWSMESVAFLECLQQTAQGKPIFVVATVRRGQGGEMAAVMKRLEELTRKEEVEEILLEPLSEAEHRDLVGRILGLGERLRERVLARTEGNPLFAIQLVGDWVERGLLVVGEAGFELREGVDVRLPDDIHQVLKGRLELLLAKEKGEGEWEALELAAMLGQRVEMREWTRLAGAGVDLEGLLERMLEAQLVRRVGRGWRFLHGALRESLERMAREEGRWRAYQERCGRMLLDVYGERERGVAERVGRHLVEAEEYEEGARHLLRGAVYYGERTLIKRSHELFGLYFEALYRAGVASGEARFVEGYLRKANVCIRENDFEGARASLRAAAEGLDDAGAELRGENAYLWGVIIHLGGDPVGGAARAREAERIFEEAADDQGVARALYLQAEILTWRGKGQEGLELYRRAQVLFEKGGGVRDRAKCELAIGVELAREGLREEGLALMKSALKGFRSTGDRYALGVGISNLGVVYRQAGKLVRAREIYERGIEIHEGAGIREVGLYLNYCVTLLELGEFERVGEVVARLMPEAEAAKRNGVVGLLEAKMLAVQGSRGDWEGWERSLGRAKKYLEVARIFDEELARTFEIAAGVARVAREEERAMEAETLAEWQRENLGDPG